ncbi:zinc ribbon domain-containing protein [Nonomuraea maritima]|uniref:zinc ribbon domain-containing protein n=1 Tax=Nonomuraea maritima TaxID=683260 RepID=UPI0037158F01
MKAKLPLHVRTYACDACGLVIDRDANAARNLAALAARRGTGTGVAGDQGTAPAVPKPRGADQKPRHPHPLPDECGAGRWRNPAAAAAEGSERPSSGHRRTSRAPW